jgi:hypothetical protein
MGRCDQGIKFCSKIESAWNRFNSKESVGLIVTNPMQLIWVQTNVGSERYHVLFKMVNTHKRDDDCIVHTVHMDDDMAGRTMMWQTVIGQLACDMVCW